MKVREVITYKEYFDDFFKKQPQKVRDKIIKVLDIIEQIDRIPMTYLKMNTKTLDQIKNEYYGEVGAPERDRLERELEALRIGFKIRSAREKLDMTQAELASRIDKKRTFISKVENDGENITLKTLFDIVERGLGGKLNIEVQL